MEPPNHQVIGQSVNMEMWWHRYSEAFEAEKSALDALGHLWKMDEAAWEAGRLHIHIEIPHEDTLLELRAEYPDTFPYFPPQVFLQGASFNRHQHLLGKNLCLLAREGEDWHPGRDTLAILLRDQLPLIQQVNAAEASSNFVADNEDHVGEPFSSFLPYLPNGVIVVPDETPALEHNAGRLTLRVRPLPPNSPEVPFVNGILGTISDLARKPIIEFSSTPPVFSEKMNGFWLRLPERPSVIEGSELEAHFFDLMWARVPAFKKAIETAKRGQIFVVGFVYPDEVAWRSNSDDWVFLAIRIKREAKGAHPGYVLRQFIRADWGGEHAWMQRAPALRPLRGKSVLLVGLGSLGSPLGLHLARAGIGQLHLVDCDHLQVGNTVRWALGWQYAGLQKVLAIKAHLQNEYPYTSVHAYNVRIGAPTPPQEGCLSDYQLIRSVSEKVDLIIDAAANHRVSHFLADLAQELGKPYLWLTTTHGASGGIVGRIRPGKTIGCWHCFQHSLDDGSIRLPADTGTAEIQPGGCSQPTFIGAGVDSDEVALLAARLAVATLCSGESCGYPDFSWDVAIGDFARDGHSISPDWTPYTLTENSGCVACGSR